MVNVTVQSSGDWNLVWSLTVTILLKSRADWSRRCRRRFQVPTRWKNSINTRCWHALLCIYSFAPFSCRWILDDAYHDTSQCYHNTESAAETLTFVYSVKGDGEITGMPFMEDGPWYKVDEDSTSQHLRTPQTTIFPVKYLGAWYLSCSREIYSYEFWMVALIVPYTQATSTTPNRLGMASQLLCGQKCALSGGLPCQLRSRNQPLWSVETPAPQ